MAKPLLIIGGQPVFLPEFRLFYDAVRSNVAGEFYRNYGTQPDRGFWHKVFPEGTPLAVAEKRALSALREWHATLELFRQEGLILTTGWPAFLARLSAENTRRTRLLAESLPVYGPKQLTRVCTFPMKEISSGRKYGGNTRKASLYNGGTSSLGN